MDAPHLDPDVTCQVCQVSCCPGMTPVGTSEVSQVSCQAIPQVLDCGACERADCRPEAAQGASPPACHDVRS